MAGNVSGVHVFAADPGPESLSLLDGVNNAFIASLNSVITFSNNYVDTGSVNALVVTVAAPQVFGYVDGAMLQVKVALTNTTTTPNINVNGLGVVNIVNADGSAVGVGQLHGGGWVNLQYEAVSGTFMIMGGGSITAGSPLLAANNTWTGTNTFAGALTVATATGATLVLASTATPELAYVSFGDSAAPNDAYVGWAGSPNDVIVGSGRGSLNLRANNAAINLSVDNGAGSAVIINSLGQMGIAAPVSGNALTINGVSNSQSLFVSSLNGSAFAAGDIYVTRESSAANSVATGPCIQFEDSSGAGNSTVLQQSGGQTELWQFNSAWHQLAFWLATRGLVLNQPASGYGLKVTAGASAGTGALILNNGSGPNIDFGGYQTGGASCTFTGVTNKPGSNGGVIGYVPVGNGAAGAITGYIPIVAP